MIFGYEKVSRFNILALYNKIFCSDYIDSILGEHHSRETNICFIFYTFNQKIVDKFCITYRV